MKTCGRFTARALASFLLLQQMRSLPQWAQICCTARHSQSAKAQDMLSISVVYGRRKTHVGMTCCPGHCEQMQLLSQPHA